MLVAITEVNMWEREKWTYILDLDKQGAQVMNWLNIFVKFAAKQFEKDASAAKGQTEVFAASNYWVKFYDKNGWVRIKHDSLPDRVAKHSHLDKDDILYELDLGQEK